MITEIQNFLKHRKLCAMPKWLKTRPDIVQWLTHTTVQYPVKNTMEQVYIVLNGEPPRCSDGNYRKFNTFTTGYRTGCDLGNKCKDVIRDRIEKQQQGFLEKYGVTNSSQIPGIQERIKQTSLEKYGVEHHMKLKSQQELVQSKKNSRSNEEKTISKLKTQNTNLVRYGETHHMKLGSQQLKTQTTHAEKHGVLFPLQNKNSVKQMRDSWQANNDVSTVNLKRKVTLFERYNVGAASRIYIPDDTLKILDDENLFTQTISGKTREEAITILKIAPHTLYLYAKKYDASKLFARPLSSKFEIEIAEWLTSINITYEQGNRNIIFPQELDFYIPNLNVAIECGGLYWHSENSSSRTRNYHASKHKHCAEHGIRLVTMFQDEWDDRKEQCKAILINILGKSSVPLYARQCSVEEISHNEAKMFIEQNHIQGFAPAKVNIGLKFNDKLISIMTFRKARFNNTVEWELIRYCSSTGVVGGANKMMSMFVKTYFPKSIVSYSDNRWFTGNVYNQLGFVNTSTNVGYCYTDYKKRFSRNKFQKAKLVAEGYDGSMSEWEIMQSCGFDRIWDCGQTTWKWKAS